MKRIRAHILPLLISVALLPPALAEAATKPVRAAAVKAPAKAKAHVRAKSKAKRPVQKEVVAPGLPDRNPLRVASPDTPAPESQETAEALPAPSAAPEAAPEPTSSPETTAGLQQVGTPPAPEPNSQSTRFR